jgi:hypothetical protein
MNWFHLIHQTFMRKSFSDFTTELYLQEELRSAWKGVGPAGDE